MATLTVYSFHQVRAAFQASMVAHDSLVVDDILPPACSAIGDLLLQMGLNGQDFIGREHINALALSQLDKYVQPVKRRS
jgi:hypothetical protein